MLPVLLPRKGEEGLCYPIALRHLSDDSVWESGSPGLQVSCSARPGRGPRSGRPVEQSRRRRAAGASPALGRGEAGCEPGLQPRRLCPLHSHRAGVSAIPGTGEGTDPAPSWGCLLVNWAPFIPSNPPCLSSMSTVLIKYSK